MPRKLEILTKQTITSLLEETGHVLGVSDLDEINALDGLAWKVVHPTEQEETDLLDLPVKVGNLKLRRLSWGALGWLEECAYQWFVNQPVFLDLATVYASVYSREPDALYALDGPRAARKTLKKWSRTFSATYEEVINAVEKVLPEPDAASYAEAYRRTGDNGNGKNGHKVNYGPMVALLVREYGQTPEYWFWKASTDKSSTMLADVEARINAEDEEMKRAAARAKQPMVTRSGPRLAAIDALRKFEKHLRAKWQTETST